MTTNRHLTAAEKEATVADWLAYRAGPFPEGDLGGLGYPDPPIFALTDALNALPGVCTTQSCAGHIAPHGDWCAGEDPGHTHHWPAQLWLRLDAATAARFYARAPELAASPLVERVSVLWLHGEEVVDIVFHGDERGKLAESSARILDFFRSLAQ